MRAELFSYALNQEFAFHIRIVGGKKISSLHLKLMPPPTYFPLRWESTGDQWWYASPIDWAAANGHYDLVRELLRLDANHLIKLTSLRRIRRLETVWDDEEQFHDVARCRSEVARKLLSECEVKKGNNSLIGGGYGGWVLYTAASAGDMGFVRELVERDPLLVFGEGEYGVTDILYAAARSKNSELFKVVLDLAASPRLGGGEEQTGEIPGAYSLEIMNRAVHAAARGGNLRLMKELLRDCSDDALGYRDNQGATVLHAAAARGQVEIVKDIASSYSSCGIMEARDKEGKTALHVAAERGHLAAVEALIMASPSSITARDNAGETFLHAVVSGFQSPGFRRLDRQIDLMKHLLSGKLFPAEEAINATNKQGRSALHLAMMMTGNIHSDLVGLLMSVRGIDVNIRDASGMTPLDILRQRPQSASSELLTRQLISAGGIFTWQDYSARRAIASHIKRQSMGSSPGTSFRVSDVEIFLHTGLEINGNASSDHGSRLSSYSPTTTPAAANKNNAAQRLKRLLHWPKMKKKKKKNKNKSKVVEKVGEGEGVPVPLRQRFAKASSSSSNKRGLSVRSNQPSPTAKKKLASGVMHGVMQAVPAAGCHRSRSSSFSKLSFSSLEGGGGGAQIQSEGETGIQTPTGRHLHGLVNSNSNSNSNNKRYLCFGGPRQLQEPYDLYERTVLSAA